MGLRIGVIGGGIIGLAVARELSAQRPGADVVLFEKEPHVAAHQTGRNSGVVHAGLYYEPGGLKARLCRRGAGLLRDFARQKQVAYQECGKIVVAKDEREHQRLRGIYAKATANGAPGVRMIGPAGIQEIEPYSEGVAALHSPQTAIVDYRGVAEALADDLISAGAQVRLSTEVTSVREDALSGAGGRAAHISSRDRSRSGASQQVEAFDLVVVCAGLQSDRIARASGESRFPKIVPFYGDYFMLAHQQAQRVNGLIYPVPDPRYPFLGVHITPRYDGEVMLGPNAFLSLGREIYRRRRLSPKDVTDVVTSPGFWRFASKNVPAMVRETRTALSRRAFVEEANKYLPGIEVKDVTPGPRGVRAQAMHADGRLADDFVISGGSRVVHVRNAPSPGATSALAIAEHIAGEALSRRRGA
ncbi:MAG: L-2-hydroxyglutarate oxidase [Nesterenkonia sp.]